MSFGVEILYTEQSFGTYYAFLLTKVSLWKEGSYGVIINAVLSLHRDGAGKNDTKFIVKR